MVKLHIKKGDESRFLFESPSDTLIDTLIEELCSIYNGQLKVHRLADEITELSKHGLTLPPQMQGLTDEQIVELKLTDEWGEKCIPSGGYLECKDTIGKRNGKAPTSKMADILTRTVEESKKLISKDLVKQDVCMTKAKVKEAIDILKGAVTIVYPMGLPPHEAIRMEFDNEEDLSGKQAGLEVIGANEAALWFSGKEMIRSKFLRDFTGKNEKTKIIAKLTKKSSGPPSREPVIDENEQRNMMAYYYKKQEEWKKLESNDEDAYLNSAWADNKALKNQLHGLTNIRMGPR